MAIISQDTWYVHTVNLCDYNYLLYHKGGDSPVKKGFSKEFGFACTFAESMLHNVCKNLTLGTVTVSDLELVNSHKEQLKRLCTASKDKDSKVFINIETAVKIRINELKQLTLHQDSLKTLYRVLPPNIRGKN